MERPGTVPGRNIGVTLAANRDERQTVIDLDRTTDEGARVATRLETERVAWLTTVSANGTPQSSPIWFLWDGSEFLIYSLESPRVANIEGNPRVSLNLDSDGRGGDIVVVEGTARIDRDLPSAADNPEYLAKYQPVVESYGWTSEWFAGRYKVPIVVTPTRYRHY